MKRKTTVIDLLNPADLVREIVSGQGLDEDEADFMRVFQDSLSPRDRELMTGLLEVKDDRDHQT